MLPKLKKWLGFPFGPEVEKAYMAAQVKAMYKPLLVVVMAVMFSVAVLAYFCLFRPALIAPPAYIGRVTAIHTVFLFFTFVVLCLAVLLRRQLLEYPRFYFGLCNGYAVGCCIWSSVLAACASYSIILFTAFIYVSMCVSIITVLKLWQAITLFLGNYMLFLVLVLFVWPSPQAIIEGNVANAALAAVVSIIISTTLYRYRTRTFYDKVTIQAQMEQINVINAKLQALVHVDNLTGSFNRRYYDETLPQNLAQMLAAGGRVCCIMLDVDHFKRYNDHYGHQMGDICLRQVAELARNTLAGRAAYFVRYGGEEFFVLAAVKNETDAHKLADKMRQAVADNYIEHLASPKGRVTVSAGAVVCNAAGQAGGCELEALTQRADAALYQAKKEGRDRVVFDTAG